MPSFRAATLVDVNLILPMMREFYAFEGIPFEEGRSTKLLEQLLGEPTLGRAVIIEEDRQIAGYIIITFGFSLEFGGRDAFIDELYVRPELRARGLGTAAIEFAFSLCNAEGIKALHLEADHFNDRAHDLYLRLGFKDHKRHLMTRWL